MDEQEAIRLSKNGNGRGFRAIFQRYARYLYTLAFRILKDPQLAEDAVQECMLSVFRSLNQFQGKSRFKTWLYTILYRASLKIKKKRAFEVQTTVVDFNGIDRRLSTTESRLDVKKIMDRLSEKERAVLIMAYWDDLSCNEIGEVMGLKGNHVKILLFRARKHFLEQWNYIDIDRGENNGVH
ncbi:RNA polymerase sigma factor [Candidatus Riflebacteria bacterium]